MSKKVWMAVREAPTAAQRAQDKLDAMSDEAPEPDGEINLAITKNGYCFLDGKHFATISATPCEFAVTLFRGDGKVPPVKTAQTRAQAEKIVWAEAERRSKEPVLSNALFDESGNVIASYHDGTLLVAKHLEDKVRWVR